MLEVHGIATNLGNRCELPEVAKRNLCLDLESHDKHPNRHFHSIPNWLSRIRDLKLELQQQFCAFAGKTRQIERGADADLAPGDVRLPSRAHKNLGGNPPVEVRSEIDGVAGEGIEYRSVIMVQVPEIGTDCDIGNDLEGERGRHAKGRFLLPHTEIGAGCLRLVEEIKAEVEPVFDEFGIGFEPCLKAVVHDLVAARLVATVEFRLQRQRDGQWRPLMVDEDGSYVGFESIAGPHVAVVEARNVVDTVIGDGGSEFDLHELGRRILVFKRGLTDAVAAAPLAEIGFRIRLELLVGLVSDRRADGKTEYVFCLEFVESAIFLCARYDRI